MIKRYSIKSVKAFNKECRYKNSSSYGDVNRVLNDWYERNFVPSMKELHKFEELAPGENKIKIKSSDSKGHRPGRFVNTSLPLLPDIRKASVDKGKYSKFFELFGLKLRVDSETILEKGPNKKANRYLRYNYIRMVKSLFGTVEFASVKRTFIIKGEPTLMKTSIPIHVSWDLVHRAVRLDLLTRKERKLYKKSCAERAQILRDISSAPQIL